MCRHLPVIISVFSLFFSFFYYLLLLLLLQYDVSQSANYNGILLPLSSTAKFQIIHVRVSAYASQARLNQQKYNVPLYIIDTHGIVEMRNSRNGICNVRHIRVFLWRGAVCVCVSRFERVTLHPFGIFIEDHISTEKYYGTFVTGRYDIDSKLKIKMTPILPVFLH